MSDLPKKQGVLSYLCKGSFTTKYKDHYIMLYDASRSGLARLEVYQICKSSPNKLALLVTKKDIVKVMRDEGHSPSGFTLTTKDHRYCFLARSDEENQKWTEAIQDIFLKPATRVPASHTPQCTDMEENEIYGMDGCREAATREFMVVAEEHTRLKLKMMSPLRLIVQDRHISLLSVEGKRIVRWPISNIRKMGFTTNDFHLEIGKKSDYGPGYFVFHTSQGMAINKLVSQEKECLKYQMLYSRDTFTHKQTPALPASALVRPHYSYPPPTPNLLPDQDSIASPEPYSLDNLYDTIKVSTDYQDSEGRYASKGSITHSVESLDRHVQSVKQRQAAPYTKNSSQSLEILSSKKNIKLSPTKPIAADAVNNGLETSSECSESGHLYSSLVEVKDAWKIHGCTPDQPMEPDDDGSYDVLTFSRFSANNKKHQAATEYREGVQDAKSVYSYIDFAKKNRHGHGATSNNQ
ncbi:docking protein 2-like isoform X2 [Portunus trituberculatus]|nr:docking protein 2-like isoform X2 [Portunus trituberculatus]